jgi:hypothetical protein
MIFPCDPKKQQAFMNIVYAPFSEVSGSARMDFLSLAPVIGTMG